MKNSRCALRRNAIAFAAMSVALARSSVSLATVLNDGSTTANLTQMSNSAVTGGSSNVFLNPGGQDLRLEVSQLDISVAEKAAYVASAAPGQNSFVGSADITMSVPGDNADRPGLALMDSITNKGIGLYLRGSSGYRLTDIDFNQASFESLLLNTTAYASGTDLNGKLNVSLAVNLGGVNSNNSSINITITDSSSTPIVSTTALSGLDLSGFVPSNDLSALRLGYFGTYPSTAANNNPTSVGTFDNLSLSGITPSWLINASGDWNATSNWANSAIPNGVGSIAILGPAITSAQTVYTNSAITVGSLTFNSPNTYVLTGAGSLTLQASSGPALVDVEQGTQKINLPLVVASDTTMNVASGATLIIGNPVSIAAGKTLTKNGSVLVQAPLTVAAGASLVLNSGTTSLFNAPSLAGGASVDVKNNSLTIDYSGQTSPAATIKSQLASGYAGGAWNGAGIKTSSATSNKGLGWLEDTSHESIAVKYTYYGDSNLDGTVNTADFALLAANFNGTNGVWGQGDFNYDGFVNALDFNALASNYGNVLPAPSLGTLVPEPGMCGVLAVVAMAGVRSNVTRRGRFKSARTNGKQVL
jgi:dockerin type I repeat protein